MKAKRPRLTDALIRAGAADAGNRAMRAAGRTRWNDADYAAAAREYNRLIGDSVSDDVEPDDVEEGSNV